MSDVCLVLEGTYPYVTGGVSSWVHNLIRAMPQVRFSLMTILPTRSSFWRYKYEIPPNVVAISEVYIHDRELARSKRRSTPFERELGWQLIADFYRSLPEQEYLLLPDLLRMIGDPKTRVLSPEEIFYDRRTWKLLVEAYETKKIEDSFIDYFWTWRFSHLPLFRLADAAIPRAAVYHTISTGYAGLLAAIASLRSGAPLLLTEHGIYTNERRLEIEQARWIYEKKVDRTVITSDESPFKRIWTELFGHLSRICYQRCDEIITLFENNRRMQIADGADPARTRIIPNGINLGRFRPKTDYAPAGPSGAFRLGFVGRVVPIKDVKTFLRAAKIIRDRFPDTVFPIMGPTDEDEDYFRECQAMVAMLGLGENIEFTGRVDVTKEYPRLDAVILTSVSEAMPLAILEGNACGTPAVATDVGACSELVNGRLPEDVSLGPSGLVTPIADPEATAAAVIRLLESETLRERMGGAGIERVRRFYNESDLNFAYLDLYRRYISRGLAGPAGVAAGG